MVLVGIYISLIHSLINLFPLFLWMFLSQFVFHKPLLFFFLCTGFINRIGSSSMLFAPKNLLRREKLMIDWLHNG